jgi:hypothetical protein
MSVAFGVLEENGEAIKSVKRFRDVLSNRLRATSSTTSAFGAVRPLPRLPVALFDECWPKHTPGSLNVEDQVSEASLLLNLLRTLMRAMGIASFFMGTTVNAVKCIQNAPNSQASRGAETSRFTWARLLVRLPRCKLLPGQIGTLTASGAVTEGSLLSFLSRLWSSRSEEELRRASGTWSPLAHHLLWQQLDRDNHVDLTTGVARAAMSLYMSKNLLRTLQGIRGQVQYLLGGELSVDDHVLINYHFAALPSNASIVLEPLENNNFRFFHVSDDTIDTSGAVDLSSSSAGKAGATRNAWPSPDLAVNEWSPVPQLPTCAQDPLLPLLLAGCSVPAGSNSNHPAPFRLGDTILTASMAYIVTKLMGVKGAETMSIQDLNSIASQRDFNALESVAVLATQCASTCAGPYGCSVEQFLCSVVAELQVDAVAAPLVFNTKTVQLRQVWVHADGARIPFMVRSGDTYPSHLIGSVMGTAARTPNAAEVDQLWTLLIKVS